MYFVLLNLCMTVLNSLTTLTTVKSILSIDTGTYTFGNSRPCVFYQDATSPKAVLSGSGEVMDDAITWTKGEVLGRGAYGTVSLV